MKEIIFALGIIFCFQNPETNYYQACRRMRDISSQDIYTYLGQYGLSTEDIRRIEIHFASYRFRMETVISKIEYLRKRLDFKQDELREFGEFIRKFPSTFTLSLENLGEKIDYFLKYLGFTEDDVKYFLQRAVEREEINYSPLSLSMENYRGKIALLQGLGVDEDAEVLIDQLIEILPLHLGVCQLIGDSIVSIADDKRDNENIGLAIRWICDWVNEILMSRGEHTAAELYEGGETDKLMGVITDVVRRYFRK